MSTTRHVVACSACLFLLDIGCGSDAHDVSVASGGAQGGGAGAVSSGGTSGAGATAFGGSSGGTSGAPSGGVTAGSAGSHSGGSGGGAGTGAASNSGSVPFKGVANSPCAARKALNVSWYYNWTQAETEPCSDGTGGEFVPMIWGHAGAEQTAGGIKSAISMFWGKGYRNVLGFNEPDNASQSNLSIATAISLLPNFNQPGLSVGSPATQANTAGQSWFKEYMGQVAASTSLRADFIAIHWYGWNAGSCDANAAGLESYLKYAEGFSGNRPIWLTEWSCLNQSAPTPEAVLAFYRGALAVFARHPRLQRYAWFPWTANCELTAASGALTPLGIAYAAASPTKSTP